jgi:hypothetical protein
MSESDKRPTRWVRLVRGDIDCFPTELDATLAEPWGPVTLVRGEVGTVDVLHKLVTWWTFCSCAPSLR